MLDRLLAMWFDSIAMCIVIFDLSVALFIELIVHAYTFVISLLVLIIIGLMVQLISFLTKYFFLLFVSAHERLPTGAHPSMTILCAGWSKNVTNRML